MTYLPNASNQDQRAVISRLPKDKRQLTFISESRMCVERSLNWKCRPYSGSILRPLIPKCSRSNHLIEKLCLPCSLITRSYCLLISRFLYHWAMVLGNTIAAIIAWYHSVRFSSFMSPKKVLEKTTVPVGNWQS